jgi:hypothetical protein
MAYEELFTDLLTAEREEGLAHLYVPCKGGNDEVAGHGWKIGTQAALVPTFAKPRKGGWA